MPEPLRIAQVSPFPWEDEHEVSGFVARLSGGLAALGHRVVVLVPSRSPALVRESRRIIRAGGDELWDPDGGVRVLGVGEVLPQVSRRATAPSLPIDIARTIEEALSATALDFVHVHEPFAPSAASVALRHSRALNVGTFHAAAERVLSTQVARRFVELFFGRLDARTASFHATGAFIDKAFPAPYRVIHPGAQLVDRPPRVDGPLRIAFRDAEDRAALRLFLRALRRLPLELPWEATILSYSGTIPPLRRGVRERVTVLRGGSNRERELLADADVLVLASAGAAPAPSLAIRALGAGVVPVAARLPAYTELLDGERLGRHFEPADPDGLATELEQLARAGCEPLRGAILADRTRWSWERVASEFDALLREVAERRHDGRGQPELRRRLTQRPMIDVDLHMHTDHSGDCATPVDVLLATARDQGLGAIAVTDHNEVSGALDAAGKAADYGVKVIVGEEVMTATQGEVIGLFLEERIPRGMSLEETIAAIRAQGGLVYVPHPFDRLHAVPDYEHLLTVLDRIDALEVFNPRVAIPAFNEEALRFAAKYRIVAGAGSDSHVAQGLGSVRIRMRDFEGPDEFLQSLRDADIIRQPASLLYVQALKFLQTKATPPAARRAARERKVRRALASREGNGEG